MLRTFKLSIINLFENCCILLDVLYKYSQRTFRLILIKIHNYCIY